MAPSGVSSDSVDEEPCEIHSLASHVLHQAPGIKAEGSAQRRVFAGTHRLSMLACRFARTFSVILSEGVWMA